MSGLEFIIIGVIGGLIIIGLVEGCSRWKASRALSQALDRADAGQPASASRAALEPESRFIIRLSEREVVCERPDGTVERVAWNDLQKVEVVTTSDGPFSPDVFWMLHGTTEGCAVPQGATGEKELLERLQALPGFDNQALIEAMSSVSDRKFLCWQRT